MNGTQITIVGNITKDPALRYTASGSPICGLSVAVNYRKFNKSTQDWEEEEATFYDVTCFDQMAENVAESVPKGARVMVHGRLRNRSWVGRDGETRRSLEIVADEVGPSLRWATASVERTPRNSNGPATPRTAPAGLEAELAGQFAPVGVAEDPFG